MCPRCSGLQRHRPRCPAGPTPPRLPRLAAIPPRPAPLLPDRVRSGRPRPRPRVWPAGLPARAPPAAERPATWKHWHAPASACCAGCRPARNSRAWGSGSNLWSWQRAQPIVWARNAGADRVDLLVHHVHLKLLLVLLFEIGVAQHQERRGDELPAALLERVGRHQVAGHLLLHELVERPIAVERVDHIIAISPGILEDEAAKRERFAKAGDVQPVPAPALAKLRRGQQPVHQSLVAVGRCGRSDMRRSARRRRQSDQIEIEPPNAAPPARHRPPGRSPFDSSRPG